MRRPRQRGRGAPRRVTPNSGLMEATPGAGSHHHLLGAKTRLTKEDRGQDHPPPDPRCRRAPGHQGRRATRPQGHEEHPADERAWCQPTETATRDGVDREQLHAVASTMPTQPPDQEEKEGRRRGTRRGARSQHLKGRATKRVSGHPEWMPIASSDDHAKRRARTEARPSEWTCAGTQARWPRLIETMPTQPPDLGV